MLVVTMFIVNIISCHNVGYRDDQRPMSTVVDVGCYNVGCS